MKRLTVWLFILFSAIAFGTLATKSYLALNVIPDLPPPALVYETSAIPNPPSCFPGLSMKVEKLASTSYFPPGAFADKPEHETFAVDWYAKHLKAMGETALASNSYPESYRFLWLRTFHHPVAITIWRAGDEYFLNAKQLDGAGGYKPGQLITNNTYPLTKDQWGMFTRRLERTCYWSLPSMSTDLGGNDGAQWILEGSKDDRYHVVDRWTPNGGVFREACLYLLALSKIDVPAEDIY